ncbi:MAG: hypothetical protein ACRDOM_08310 [Nocardioides sp.]
MKDTATFRRTAVALSLFAAVVTSAAWTLTMPPFPDGYDARLAAIDAAGASATVSAVFFPVSQLFMLGAVLGIAHLIRRGAPILSNLGGSIAVVGTLAHAIFGGVNLMTLRMAADEGNRQIHAALLEDFESSPFMILAAAGLLGTVLGFLLLSIGLFRSRVVPRWVPALMWAFLVVEFVGTSLSDYATYVSALALALSFGALARHVLQTPRADWDLAADARSRTADPVAAA